MKLVNGEWKITMFDRIKRILLHDITPRKINPAKIEHMPEGVSKFWECNRCGYHFGSPWFDLQREMKRCTACGNDSIKIFKVMKNE